MTPIRILQCVADLGYGGAERVACELVRSIDRKAIEVRVLSLQGAMDTALEHELERERIVVEHLDKRPGFHPSTFLAADRVVRAYRPHVVHTHTRALRYLLPSILQRAVPVSIHTIHNLAKKEAGRAALLHRWAFRLGVEPVAIASSLGADVERTYGRAGCVVIDNGIDLGKYGASPKRRASIRASESLANDHFVFLNVGRLAPQKNHPHLVRAFAALARDVPQARLLIAGDGPDRHSIAALVRDLGVESQVRLLGNRVDVPDLLAAADAFVLSSDWEGNPLVVMEAMASGRAVVATAVGAVPDLIDHEQTGWLVPPGDQHALTEAMRVPAEQPRLAAELGRRAGVEAGRRFSATTMAERYRRLYLDMLERRGDRRSDPGGPSRAQKLSKLAQQSTVDEP